MELKINGKKLSLTEILKKLKKKKIVIDIRTKEGE